MQLAALGASGAGRPSPSLSLSAQREERALREGSGTLPAPGRGAHLASAASGASTMGLKCAAVAVKAVGSNVAPSVPGG